jgi:hypothetical protein
MSDYPVMHWDAGAGQWVQPASQPAGTQRHGDPGASGPGLALAQSGEDDDTGYGYDDAPSGSIWRPGAEPGQPPAPSLGGLRRRAWAAGLLPGREAAADVRPAGPRRLPPSLIVRTWHHRPGRGSVRPDKETP